MSLRYEPSSEPLHISAKQLFSNSAVYLELNVMRALKHKNVIRILGVCTQNPQP